MTELKKNTESVELFRSALKDIDELVAVSKRASELFKKTAVPSFQRLSDILDEILPTEPASEARVARALSMHVEELRRLRARQLDPLHASGMSLATLRSALGLERKVFLRLVAADHAVFPIGQIARGGGESEQAAWASLEAAFERVALDAPAGSSQR